MITTRKVATGTFDVLRNGQDTGYQIVNGNLGKTGHDPNVYGIVTPTGGIRWIGTLAACKKLLAVKLSQA